MNIDKAIQVLLEGSELSFPWQLKDYEDALKLGTEGLKRIRVLRVAYHCVNYDLLPGETE